jgi:phosphate starvation-inducible protein PhoH and related proteins
MTVILLTIIPHNIIISTSFKIHITHLIEKVVTLEDISLVDFLGVENANIKTLSNAFPMSKIISRGNEIIIKGSPVDIIKISEILDLLLSHFQKYGKLNQEQVNQYVGKNPVEPSEEVEAETEVLDEPTADDVLLYGTRGNVIKIRTANQRKMVEMAQKNDLMFAVGPAGTGKTYTAVAIAVKALKNKEVKKIIITRPAVEAGENLGFLPGDLKEKIDPYLRPIYDALDDMIQPEKLKFYLENRTIEIAPLAYMRGRTLNHAFILLDEAQNTTPMQIKMFLTRMGPNSKTIITGDRSQVDLPKNQKSGLSEALHILKDIKGIGFVTLDGKDVVRHRLVREIINAYDKHEESNDSNKHRSHKQLSSE